MAGSLAALVRADVLLVRSTTGVKPEQNVLNHAEVGASRELELSPTVVVGAVVRAEALEGAAEPVPADEPPELAGAAALDGAAALEGAAALDGALLAAVGAELMAEVFTVAVPLVELQPARSRPAPRTAASQLVRFI